MSLIKGKCSILFLILYIIFLPLEKSFAQKENAIYLQFNNTYPGMDIIQYGSSKDQHKYFRYKMIRKGDSYKKAIGKYTGKKWEGKHIARKNNYLLFKVNDKQKSNLVSLGKIKSYNLKDIKWLKKNYFNHFLDLKSGAAKYMYDINRYDKAIYIVEIDSSKSQATLTKVTYNLPITR